MSAQDVPLIAADEPPAYVTVASGNAREGREVVFVCDHASNRVPAALDRLGLDERHLLDHIAWDIGAAAVALKLAEWLGGRGVLAGYSRLVVDLNRNLADGSAFAPLSDGVLVPGNIGLDDSAKAARAAAFYWPYHDAIDRVLDDATTDDARPVMIAVHSFTPRLHGIERPWHIGVLWDKDPRLPLPILAALRRHPDIVAGDNEPYSGRHPADFTIDYHAEPRGIAHVSLEIRQDMIRDEDGQMRWAERLADVLDDVLNDPALYRPAPATALGTDETGAGRHAVPRPRLTRPGSGAGGGDRRVAYAETGTRR
ncbi:MAG TPA: N-formylglutamate amidohydrolase [Gammaproteobacteria bacterium]